MDIKISIVMPLYNAEKFLPEALDSIYNQTFQEYEIIFVNDCSDDNTQEIIDAYRKKDDRARCIILHEKCGAGKARNIGMDQANGKYVIFLDGDDIFHKDLLKNAYEKIEKYNSDLVYFDFSRADSSDIYKKVPLSYSARFVEKYCRQNFKVTDMKISDFITINTAAWNKMYRLDYVKDSNIRFQNLPNCNDVFFVQMLFYLASKIIILNTDETMIHFRVHSELSRIANNQNPMCGFYAFDAVLQELINRKIFETTYEYFYSISFVSLYSLYLATKDVTKKRDFDRYIREVAIDRWCIQKQDYFNNLIYYVKDKWDKWFENSNELESATALEFILEDFRKQIIEQFSIWRSENKKIAIWGMGKRGRCLFKFLNSNNLSVDRLIDCSDKMQGEIIFDMVVEQPGNFDIDIIVVSAIGIIEEVDEYVKKNSDKEIKMIELESIWEY